MKISLDWLSDFVDLSGITPEDLASELTVHTAEIDGWEVVRRHVENVIVCQLAEVRSIGENMHAVVADCGAMGTFKTVCTAPNVRQGMKAALAPIGARLAGDVVVGPRTLGGVESGGMLCSPAELGMGGYSEGLLEIPDQVVNGTLLSELVPPEDVLIEIDNKSLTHRPDLWGHYGFAREIAAIFDRELRPLSLASLSAHDAKSPLSIIVDDQDGCPYYSAIAFGVDGNPPSPLLMQRRLLVLDHRPINLLVDVTNYVQLELGQPTHAFDAAHVGAVRVSAADRIESFTTLDGRSWALKPEDLLIFDDISGTPVALAGIMGGLTSQVSSETRAVVLESANFRGSRVRMTSVRLPLRTDASLRFEKKLPPVFARIGVERILHLLDGASVRLDVKTRYSSVGDIRDRIRHVDVPAGFLSRRAGASIDETLAARILRGIGFECEVLADGALRFAVPSFRSEYDISTIEDISEEVMRLFGYDNIAPKMPVAALKSAPIHRPTRAHHRMRRVLAEGYRFVEAHTYGWLTDDWVATLGYAPARPLVLVNPIGVDRSRMRDSIMPNLLALVAQNQRIRDDFRIFELGKVFIGADGADDPREWNELGGVSVVQSGAVSVEQHFREIRGAVDDLFRVADLAPPAYTRFSSGSLPWVEENMGLEIQVDGQVIGAIGLLPANIREKLVDSGHVVWFALQTAVLEGEAFPSVDCQAIPVYPRSWQDFTFVWPVEQGYAELEKRLAVFSHPFLERIVFRDFYHPKKKSPTGNYTFRFIIRKMDGTLSSDDIKSFRDTMLSNVQSHGLTMV